MSDPWLEQKTPTTNINVSVHSDIKQTSNILSFEDNFNNLSDHQNKYQFLPDSKEYLQGLERKLEKLKKGSKLIDALTEKREDCLRSLLQDTEICDKDLILQLEEKIINPESTIQNIHRYIQPMQPVTLGETVNIIKYDHLQQQLDEEEYEKQERISR